MNGLLGTKTWASALNHVPSLAASTYWWAAASSTAGTALRQLVSARGPGVSFDGPLSAGVVLDPADAVTGLGELAPLILAQPLAIQPLRALSSSSSSQLAHTHWQTGPP